MNHSPTSSSRRDEPKLRPVDAKDWTVISEDTSPANRVDLDTSEAAIEYAMNLFENLETTTVEIHDNIGRSRYTITASDL